MNRIEAALRRIASDLDERGAAWALIGGFAVSARSEPRFTRDIDIAVAVESDAAAEDLVRSLAVAGYGIGALVEQDAVGGLATVRLFSPGIDGRGVVVDLIFATAGVEAELVAGADVLEILPGVAVPVATAGHLVALKLLARDDEIRPQDAADLRALLPVLSPADEDVARTAVDLIERRGFGRGRPLSAQLAAYLDGAPGH